MLLMKILRNQMKVSNSNGVNFNRVCQIHTKFKSQVSNSNGVNFN
ncbi:hypothetical protein CAMRE0001_1322 [Campylobacter rectus RM3267]|nr:hypothetical protein CAMRE0001_1322 [Campylobacter rectus RM3267]